MSSVLLFPNQPHPTPAQEEVKDDASPAAVEEHLRGILCSNRNPSAWELVEEIEAALGWKARWLLKKLVSQLSADHSLTQLSRFYLESILVEGELDKALAGVKAPRREVQTGIDSLIHQGTAYRSSNAFQELIDFMGRFRDYAPYNNLLVRVQNPSCSFFATESDWRKRFNRKLKEDARPMLILAPMRPVMLVYELDQTEGKELPQELNKFARFEGEWDPHCLDRAVANAITRDKIRVDVKNLSSTNAGFATRVHGDPDAKMRIAIHEGLDNPSRFGVLCHELAHIYLGHLGTDKDHWWPSRTNLNQKTVEIEAEAVAFLVTSRLGLEGSSAPYVSRYLSGNEVPAAVSPDLIAKAAARIEDMATRYLEPRKTRSTKNPQGKNQ